MEGQYSDENVFFEFIFDFFYIFENGIGIRNPKGNNFVFWPEVSEASFMP